MVSLSQLWSGHSWAPACFRLSLSCNTIEDITHILKTCSALDKTRDKLITFTKFYCQDKPDIHDLIHTHCSPDRDSFCQFILDCSVLPDVINAVQINGQEILNQLFTLTRIWCYSLHRDRLKLLGRWPFTNTKWSHTQTHDNSSDRHKLGSMGSLTQIYPTLCGCKYKSILYSNIKIRKSTVSSLL